MAWTEVFAISVLPFHNTTHVCAGRRNGNDLVRARLTVIVVVAYDIAHNRLCRKAYRLISKRCKLCYWEPDTCTLTDKWGSPSLSVCGSVSSSTRSSTCL